MRWLRIRKYIGNGIGKHTRPARSAGYLPSKCQRVKLEPALSVFINGRGDEMKLSEFLEQDKYCRAFKIANTIALAGEAEYPE